MKKNREVLIITDRFYPEEFGINDLAKAWQSKGYEVAVLTQTPSYPFAKVYAGYKNRIFQTEYWEGIKIYRVLSFMGYRKGVFSKVLGYVCFALLASIVSLFIGGKYSKIFVYQTGPLTQAIPAVVLRKILGRKFYIWTLDIWPDTVFAYGFKDRYITRTILNRFVKAVYGNCETVFISCKGFRQKIEYYVKEAKIIYSPQWAPDELMINDDTPHEELKKGFNFTFAGNIGKVQNLENIIRGFARLNNYHDRVSLNIIGDGSNLEALKDILDKENIENVYLWGRKPLSEMARWFEGSDVLIISLIDQPIFELTMPAKFQAYLASKKPIYCVMNGEVADLVANNRIGYVSKPDDIDDIKSGFEKFLHTPADELQLFRKNMDLILSSEFDRNVIINRMTDEIFREIPLSG